MRLIVFDLDGTLIDSRRDLADATNALIAELGGDPLPIDAVASMVGEGAALLVRRALAAAGLDPNTADTLERFLVLYDRRLLAHTRPYEGMREALEALSASCPLAVLTNKPARATATILEALALAPYFGERVIGGDTPFGRKPDPKGLLQLVESAGATPESAVLVGDSPIDRETARRAGTRVCLVRYGFGFTFKDGDFRGDELIVDRPADLVTGLRIPQRS
jgi:phosphoglycolate phosphatase